MDIVSYFHLYCAITNNAKENTMQTNDTRQSNEVNLDHVARFSALDILGTIVIMGVAFGIIAPFLI